jgi:hypothetical protein
MAQAGRPTGSPGSGYSRVLTARMLPLRQGPNLRAGHRALSVELGARARPTWRSSSASGVPAGHHRIRPLWRPRSARRVQVWVRWTRADAKPDRPIAHRRSSGCSLPPWLRDSASEDLPHVMASLRAWRAVPVVVPSAPAAFTLMAPGAEAGYHAVAPFAPECAPTQFPRTRAVQAGDSVETDGRDACARGREPHEGQ